MKIGTKSVLYGAHCFFIHPFFVARAWWRLYGFPYDPRLWVAFFVHDLGYWGKPNMDGPEGEDHVRFGAKITHRLFDWDNWDATWFARWIGRVIDWLVRAPFTPYQGEPGNWYSFCFYHSRYMAKRYGIPPSKLCYADKFAFVITWPWLYKLSVYLTGEWKEYASAHNHEVHHDAITLDGWYRPSREYVLNWVAAHIEGKEDTWTQAKPGTNPTEVTR